LERNSCRAKGEIRDYYNRKVAESHLKKSVNAVNNKLVLGLDKKYKTKVLCGTEKDLLDFKMELEKILK
jgi:hypothetical protein